MNPTDCGRWFVHIQPSWTRITFDFEYHRPQSVVRSYPT